MKASETAPSPAYVFTGEAVVLHVRYTKLPKYSFSISCFFFFFNLNCMTTLNEEHTHNEDFKIYVSFNTKRGAVGHHTVFTSDEPMAAERKILCAENSRDWIYGDLVEHASQTRANLTKSL